ncbi:hypothetical protein AXE65_08575 [Ventosimonas gracilis]|uniref:Pilus assembly protein PilW n=1 Tax=Ventosimonas gracilis TaxID=1680762 RepID=A0A139SYE0_9GAMM|nr:prepilin-type N-terminal cleavage/methylation domain-containing protein [Ventosimonas gracilis]KXU39410.1 hypothetical protein AXE65_08575 [Ventosimonas gracilis]
MKSFIANYPKAQSGLSLIELMVALLVSTILLLGVLELFGSSSQTQRSANAVARLQENGRLVMDLIAREARRTGFNGCDGGLDSSDVDFGTGWGGTINFPDESLKGSTNTSLTIRYYGSPDGVTKDNCERRHLSKNYIEFKNDGNNLRVISSDTGTGGQILLNHAKIDRIDYLQPCTADPTETCTYKTEQLPKLSDGITPSFKEVQKLQVTLTLCSDTLSENSTNYCVGDTTAIKRTFKSLIDLRNRP